MFGITTVKIRSFEKGLYFRDREFRGLLGADRHWFAALPGKVRVEIVSQRNPWLVHKDLDLVIKSGALAGQATVLDLKEYERALVWIDGRFAAVVAGGQYALWTAFRQVRTEVVDARAVRFEHTDLAAILRSPGADKFLEEVTIEDGHVGVFFRDGAYIETLAPGRYAMWKGVQRAKVLQVNKRELTLDVSGQEIMTADKVTLRLNVVATYRVVDALAAVDKTEDARQALYREAQLAIRAVVGTRELDALLADKDTVAAELEAAVRSRAAEFGLAVTGLGIRDIILPGEMKDLLNKVIEARKAAEANLIARREETAAMRNQANTAKLLEASPTLMRLRELEVLEKVAGNSKLSVVLGEKGLADRVVNLL
jgi:hypothetical protein